MSSKWLYICGVHGIKIQNDAGKVFIKSIYAKIVPNWDKHDPDIHTCGTWIKWKLEDNKLYQPIEKISIDPKSQATDKTGPQYVEHGRKREQNPNELTVVVRKNKCVRGLSYSPRKSLNIKKNRAPSRKMAPPRPPTCKRKWTGNTTKEERTNSFKFYWEVADMEKQQQYISNNIKSFEKERIRKIKNIGPSKLREQSFVYYLGDTMVYKQMFLQTFEFGEILSEIVWKNW